MADPVLDRERPSKRVSSVESACRILVALLQVEGRSASLTDLSRALGLPKSTTHSLLNSLEAHGFLWREPDSRRYRLGAALVALGQEAARATPLAAMVADRLPMLARIHGVTFALTQVTEHGDAQVIARAYPMVDVHVGLTVGARYGPFDGAMGKCLLAAVTEQEAADLVRSAPVTAHTAQTITDPDALLADIAEVRARGWAVSVQELKHNHAVAAGLRGLSGRTEHIVCAVAFPDQMPWEKVEALGGVLADLARSVESELGLARVPEAVIV
jgi:IclR family acetate operon transcriptional repressor